ncbi:MAG: protein phosphatase 2C domain-containing protein [Clostridiales bacterium]|nr:protein phosphatase 2C domain-containing protein [Clostridiales bacterium]
MAYQIDYAYTCHIGKVRANNEDNFWCSGVRLPVHNQGLDGVLTGHAKNWDLPVLAVFDGMGGESCGEVAAFLAVEELGRYYEQNRKNLRREPHDFLRELCENMNRAVCRYSREKRVGSMGATAAFMAFGEKNLYACNVGDSRIYEFCDGKLEQISTDHVAFARGIGKAPLTQYLGLDEENMVLEPSLRLLPYQAGSRYLICSDGVTDMLTLEELREFLGREGTAEAKVSAILKKALEKGGRDNVTMILIQIEGSEEKNPFKIWMGRHGADC